MRNDMDRRIQILNSKLAVPYSTETIKRERLHPLLSEILKKKLTTVIAGAGFGKTTLIAEVGNLLNSDTVWYRIDKSDRDFISFLSYLIAGIKKYYPGFGEKTLTRISRSQEFGTQKFGREYESVLTIFLSELEEHISRDMIIIIDDYHFIQETIEINDSLEFIIENLPQNFHIVIISRADPGLHLSKFRARRELLDIREDNIVFSITEVEDLFNQLFGVTMDRDSLKSLHKKTDGWVSGLILFYHSIKGKSQEEIEELLYNLKGSHRNISNYLEENVFAIQADEIKDFLIKTSILNRVNASFCNQLLGITNSGKILKELEENHLFTFPIAEERDWYSYHHLLQDFLQNKLNSQLDKKAVEKLHYEAAMLWEKKGESEESLRHYLQAGHFDRVCVLLGTWGLNKLIKEGRLQLIRSYLEEIPESYLNKDPWLQYMQAHMLELSGTLEEAIQSYNKALKAFRRQQSISGEIMSLRSLFYSNLVYGDHRSAEKLLASLPKELKEIPQFSVVIMGILTFLAAHLGKMSLSEKYFEEGFELSGRMENKKMQKAFYFYKSLAYCFSGNFIEALKIGEELEIASENDDFSNHLLALKYQLTSFSCCNLGQFAKGVELSKNGLALVAEKGLQDLIYAWLMISLGLNTAGLGETADAINYARESLKIFKNEGSRWGQAQSYYLLYYAYELSENLDAAEQYIRAGLEVIEGLTLPIEEGILKRSLASLLIEKRLFSKALPYLKDATHLFKNSQPGSSMMHILYAKYYWEQKQKEPAVKSMISALELCETNKYDVWIIKEKGWIIPLLVEIFGRGVMQDYIKALLKEIGSEAASRLKNLQNIKNTKTKEAASLILKELDKIGATHPPGLRIYCLGKFQLFRGGEKISTESWKSKKAKALFKYLVNSRHKGFISRDILMELLWPEEDPEKSINRLHDALYSLRKIIEPGFRGGTGTLYLLREGDSYRLSLGEGGGVDVDAFRDEIYTAKNEKDPEKAIMHYLNAEKLYQGDFLEEDLYVEWCAEERAALKEEYLNLLAKIMEYYDKKGDYAKIIEYAGKYLKAEKFTDDIYQQLMILYYQMGNKPMMIKTYERYKENMEKLEMRPNREVEELFQKLSSV